MKLIDGEKFYTPMETVRMGFIHNRKGVAGTISGHYNFVLEQIKAGRLKAVDYSVGSARPYWLISETEINNFHKGAGK